MERIEQPIKDLTEGVALRAFHAIGKILADGLPTSEAIGSKAWIDPTISRKLTDQEAEAAAQIAIWIEGAAKELAKRLLSESDDEVSVFVSAWIGTKSKLEKVSKGLSSNTGRIEGAKANKEKAEAAKEKWMPAIREKRDKHPGAGKRAIYDYLAKDIKDGKHGDIKAFWRSYGTVKGWIPAKIKKNCLTSG